jgi:hypothetical protein
LWGVAGCQHDLWWPADQAGRVLCSPQGSRPAGHKTEALNSCWTRWRLFCIGSRKHATGYKCIVFCYCLPRDVRSTERYGWVVCLPLAYHWSEVLADHYTRSVARRPQLLRTLSAGRHSNAANEARICRAPTPVTRQTEPPGPPRIPYRKRRAIAYGATQDCHSSARSSTEVVEVRGGVAARGALWRGVHPLGRGRAVTRADRPTWFAHSCSRLYSANKMMSSIIRLNDTSCRTTNKPGIGRPSRTRLNAWAGIVCASCVRRARPSLAAQSRIISSCCVRNPTSCTRRISTCGRARSTPRTMARLKSSSARRRSKGHTLLSNVAWRRARSRARRSSCATLSVFVERSCSARR